MTQVETLVHEQPSMVRLIQSVGPPSFGRTAELFDVFREVLELSGVKRKDRVAVLADTRSHKEIVEAFFGAALSLGAEPVTVIIPPLKSLEDPNEVVLKLLMNMDLVINVMSMEWGKQKGAKDLSKAGIRVIMCAENPDTLIKMRPSKKVMQRVENFVNLIDSSSDLVITSESGTNISFRKLTGSHASFLNGVLEPSKKQVWTNFPNSVVSFPFDPRSGNGELVLEPGDVYLHLAHMVREKVKLKLKNSRITSIEGGFDALILKEKWFDRWNDGTKYDLLHLDFGCDHRAEVVPGVFAPMEWESYAGGVLFGFGFQAHIDIMLSKLTVMLDGKKVIDKGTIVYPTLV